MRFQSSLAAGPVPAAGCQTSLRRTEWFALLPSAVRRPGTIPEYLLHRRRTHPADHPRRRLSIKELGKKKIYLLGSDYVFPRTANLIIKKQLEAMGVELAGEEYVPLGGTEFSTIISKIQEAAPDAIFNTLNGDSNVAFFKQFKDAGFTAESLPVMSVSVAEEEVRGIGTEYLAGHFTMWNYYQTVDSPENKKFVEAYKKAYGRDRVTSDPAEAGYFGICGKQWLKNAGTEVAKVKEAAASNEISFAAPERYGQDRWRKPNTPTRLCASAKSMLKA